MDFDEQVVRLENIKDLADGFVRVRLPRIEHSDLNLFQFDYDITFMVFFLNADERIYGRFGGRDADDDAESRMSLAGLKFAMQAALDAHEKQNGSARPARKPPKIVRQLPSARRFGGCIHCHQAKEILNAERQRSGAWSPADIWRYPLPDQTGIVLDVDGGNLVDRVLNDSAADRAGIRRGDRIESLNGVRIRSFGDAQFALDSVPAPGKATVAWRRADKSISGTLALPQGWRRADITWRPSMQDFVPYLPILGRDLAVDEKKLIGLSADQMAYRQRDPAPDRILALGIQPGDVIVGVNGKMFRGINARDFRNYVQREFLVGDKVTINILRDGKPLGIAMTLGR